VRAEDTSGWFCLRSKPKSEHVAAGHLRSNLNLEVFAPQVRFRRATRRGAVWVTEPLFPSYLFARYNLREFSHAVHYSPGIKGVVHFGAKWPTVPDQAIQELQQLYGGKQVHVIDPLPAAGDAVEIAGGAFHGLQAVVNRVLSARHRVAVLLDFLGRQTMVEFDSKQVIKASKS
jgi:transcriptional antiterminator RfaH